MTDTRLQDLKIATEWAHNQVTKATGSKISNPERWEEANKKYNSINRIYLKEMNSFIEREIQLDKEADKMQDALDSVEKGEK